MANKIAAIDNGMSYHINALNDPEWADLIAARPYLPELADTDLTAFDIVIVTCRSRPDLLARHQGQFEDFLARGGWLIASGETRPDGWLSGVTFREATMNYWWWLEEGGESGVRLRAPQHPIAAAIPPPERIWHFHGVFEPPADAVSILETKDGGSILYDRFPPGGGRTTIMAVDPFFHHGSFFMPAATEFLRGFMPFLATANTF